MGTWRHRTDHTAHKRVRASRMRQFKPGQTCCRCGHPMYAGDKINLDHNDDKPGYKGLAHASPCRTCGKRCNQSAGGKAAALRQGKTLTERTCIICGMPYRASMTKQVTCGQRNCITEIRRIRKARQPDPEAPKADGWAW